MELEQPLERLFGGKLPIELAVMLQFKCILLDVHVISKLKSGDAEPAGLLYSSSLLLPVQ